MVHKSGNHQLDMAVYLIIYKALSIQTVVVVGISEPSTGRIHVLMFCNISTRNSEKITFEVETTRAEIVYS